MYWPSSSNWTGYIQEERRQCASRGVLHHGESSVVVEELQVLLDAGCIVDRYSLREEFSRVRPAPTRAGVNNPLCQTMVGSELVRTVSQSS